MTLEFYIEKENESGYTAKAIGESIFTEAEALNEIYTNILEAVECHFDKENLPEIVTIHY